jgi:integrase
MKKTTKQSDHAKAWEVCLGIVRAEDHGRAGTLTEQTAKKIIGEIVERTSGVTLNDYKAGDWLAEWAAQKARTKAAATGVRYQQVIRDFVETLGGRAKLSLAAIVPRDVAAYREGLLDGKKSPRTANLSVKVVSSGFNAALRQGYITVNPCTALETLPVDVEEKGTFTPEQVSKLVQHAEGDWKGAILLGYFTGARLRDVANMRWQCVDLSKRTITFTPSKTKKPVTVPLHPDLEAELMKAPGVGKAFLFPTLAGKGTGGKHGLSGRFSAIMAKAEIVGRKERGKNGRAVSSHSFHSLRHSFNSAMANAGVSQEVRQKLTGHASVELNRHYTHHELEPLRTAIEAIPALGKK